jgi:hypothetical protein
VRAKLPLQKSSFSPATAPENVLIAIDGAVNNRPVGKLIALVVMMKMTDQLGTPRGRYDEHDSKFPSVRNQGFIIQEKVNTPEGDAC